MKIRTTDFNRTGFGTWYFVNVKGNKKKISSLEKRPRSEYTATTI